MPGGPGRKWGGSIPTLVSAGRRRLNRSESLCRGTSESGAYSYKPLFFNAIIL